MTSIGAVHYVYAPARTLAQRRVKKTSAPNRLGKNLRPLPGSPFMNGPHENPARTCQIETGINSASFESGMSSRFVAQVLGQVLPSSSDAARAMRAYAESKGRDPDIRFVRFL
jgi:hypothetical protein